MRAPSGSLPIHSRRRELLVRRPERRSGKCALTEAQKRRPRELLPTYPLALAEQGQYRLDPGIVALAIEALRSSGTKSTGTRTRSAQRRIARHKQPPCEGVAFDLPDFCTLQTRQLQCLDNRGILEGEDSLRL